MPQSKKPTILLAVLLRAWLYKQLLPSGAHIHPIVAPTSTNIILKDDYLSN